MNLNRNRYGSVPTYGTQNINKQKPDKGESYRKAVPKINLERASDQWLQYALVLLLPLLFIIGLLLSPVKYVYIALAAAAIAIMWLKRKFVITARFIMTAMHFSLVLITIVTLITAARPDNRNITTSLPVSGQAGISAGTNAGNAAQPQQPINPQQGQALPYPTDVPANLQSKSASEMTLDLFLGYWMENDIEHMTTLTTNTWRSSLTQNDPQTEMFRIIARRKLVEYEVKRISGTEMDTTRQAQVRCAVEFSGSAERKVDYTVFLIQENGSWYVDPNTIASGVEVDEQAEAEEEQQAALGGYEITPEPVVTVDPNTLLYYNPDGGSYYHVDANCSSVGTKYRPLTGTITYSQLSGEPYNKLKPCKECGAP
ncbi:MAG: hypothetical protein PHI27_02095 [Eubacteriales bacterium]|nr:hypothetical protein [Eubacteriales bacterium]MDD3881024.1 hypothetical protein [Eubacteriales bacterium]MDD4511907.1 hypothetical protein [Eubacteriales bacterium]